MITERKYKNALAVIEQYKEQQENLKREKIKDHNISLSTELWDLYDNKLISTKLLSALHSYHKSNVFVHEAHLPCTLQYFTGINQYGFSRWYGVGKKTVDEFVDLMHGAGHVVPKD